MPNRPKQRKLRPLADVVDHVLAAIGQIERFTRRMTPAKFLRDQKTVRATERCLKIISEASRDVPQTIKSKYPEIRWRAMADAGNLYRHGYEFVSPTVLWQTIKDHIPPLKAALQRIRDEELPK